MKRLMAGYQEFLRQPEIRPLHLDFVERKRAEQLQRQQEKEQQERQEAEVRQQSEREQHIRQEPEAVPQRRRSRMR